MRLFLLILALNSVVGLPSWFWAMYIVLTVLRWIFAGVRAARS